MRIAYNNLVDATAVTLTASTADSNYPVANIQDQRLTTVWRTTSATSQTMIVDLGATAFVTTSAIMGHNITAAASTITIAGGATASVFATAETLTYNSGAILKFFTGQSYRYWKFTVDDQTNPAGYLSIGRMWLGSYITVDPSSLVDFTVTKKRSDTVVYGKHRQKFASPGVGWRRFLLSFPESSATMVTAIETMYDTVGNHTSIIFCNFDTVRDWNIVEPCYCSIVGDVAFVNQGRYEATYTLEIEEDR